MRPEKRHLQKTSRWRRVIATTVAMALLGAGLMTAPTTAIAAPGDCTIAITSPGTVSVNTQFTEQITVSCRDGGCTDVVIEQTLPSELQFVDVPTGAEEVVASVEAVSGSLHDFGATLRFHLNQIGQPAVKTFSVTLANDRGPATTVSPDSSWDLVITSGALIASSTTKPTGTVGLVVSKTFSTVPASGNRAVTYYLSGRVVGNTSQPSEPWIGRWAT